VLCGTIVILGSPGTTQNHLLDLYVVSVLIVFTTIHTHLARAQRFAMMLVTAVAVLGSAALILHPLVGNARHTAWARKQVVFFLEHAGAFSQPRPILSFDPVIDVAGGRSAYLIESTLYRTYLDAHPQANARFVSRIREGHFPFIVLSVPYGHVGDIDSNLFAPEIGADGAQALAARYELALTAGIYRVYRVRTDPVGPRPTRRTEPSASLISVKAPSTAAGTRTCGPLGTSSSTVIDSLCGENA
jgi:hypothetical protein